MGSQSSKDARISKCCLVHETPPVPHFDGHISERSSYRCWDERGYRCIFPALVHGEYCGQEC